ncbi:MAG: cytochrome c biogenesis CcdA family protein [Firmicutes bacterium]|nr:cytochrome c biogenesis CcdA family protein [Bacillota bacterium]
MIEGINVSFGSAFLAGIISFFSPCFLPLLPVYISQLNESIAKKNRGSFFFNMVILIRALIFISGFMLVFISLGMASGAIGKFLSLNKMILSRAGGILVVIMGLSVMGLLPLNLAGRWKPMRSLRPQNSFGPFFLGIIFALSWTPCIGPFLASVLALAATSKSSLQGNLLLAGYSLGMLVPFFILCFAFYRIPMLQSILKKYSGTGLRLSGLLLIILGFLMFFDKLQ